MGRWNSTLYKKPPQDQPREIARFLTEKYGNKRWYVPPGSTVKI